MKKKLVAATLTAAMILSTGLVTVPVMAKEDGEPYKAALLLNGTLGDKSFYDSANARLSRWVLLPLMKQNGSLPCMITVMMVLTM